MPKGTDDHVGFLPPQSKQTYPCQKELSEEKTYMADLVGGFRLQFLKDLLRLGLGCEAHLERGHTRQTTVSGQKGMESERSRDYNWRLGNAGRSRLRIGLEIG